MTRRTTILLNEKIFTKLLKIQSEKILKTNSSASISSIINKIIEEQIDENHNNMTKMHAHDPVLKRIEEIKHFDHLAFISHNDENFGKQISEFIIQGLKMNLLNVLLVSENDAQKYVTHMIKNGISAHELINSQDIVVASHEEIFDKFSFGMIEPIFDQMNKLVRLAKKKKKTGMNVIGTIAGTLENTHQHDKCLNLEKIWHQMIPKFKMPLRVICPYYLPISAESVNSLTPYHNIGFVE